ncbi:unnamed protein product, partial [Lymnaea stagnalis]
CLLSLHQTTSTTVRWRTCDFFKLESFRSFHVICYFILLICRSENKAAHLLLLVRLLDIRETDSSANKPSLRSYSIPATTTEVFPISVTITETISDTITEIFTEKFLTPLLHTTISRAYRFRHDSTTHSHIWISRENIKIKA